MSILNTKRLHLAKKYHWGISSLMEKFDFATETELHDEIIHLFPDKHTAEEFWQEFVNNEKRKKKQLDKASARSSNVPNEVPAEEIVSPEEVHDEEISCESDETPVTSSGSASSILAELQSKEVELLEQEKAQSQTLMDSEAHHKRCVSKWWENHKKLDALNKELEALQNRILEGKASAVSLLDEMNRLDAQAEEAYFDILVNREQLEKTRTMLEVVRIDIENAKKATIYVYSNGEISVENVTIPDMARFEGDISALIQFATVFDDGLTIGEIKTVSRILKLVTWLDCAEISYDIVIENPNVQKFWEAVDF